MGHDPAECPLCNTRIGHEVLEELLSSDTEDERVSALAEERKRASELEAVLSQAKGHAAALRRLQAIEDRDISVENVLQEIERARLDLEITRTELASVESKINDISARGLTTVILKQLLVSASLPDLPSSAELARQIDENSRDLEAQEQLVAQQHLAAEAALRSASEIATSIGAPVSNSIADLQSFLRRNISDIDGQLAALTVLEDVLDRNTGAGVPLATRLGAASDQIAKVVNSIDEESASTAAIQREVKLIAEIESKVAADRLEIERAVIAETLLRKLVAQVKSGEFVDEVLRDNANAISEIFSSIHAPREFRIATTENTVEVIRTATGQTTTLEEMSSGQRAAYAISLFLAMNERLQSAPKLMLLDDPVAHVDDLNVLSLLDYLRGIALDERRQIFIATANEKFAGLCRQKFRFLGEKYQQFELTRG
jgi:DNA repair exonuclease SbcCD ATPase subunit